MPALVPTFPDLSSRIPQASSVPSFHPCSSLSAERCLLTFWISLQPLLPSITGGRPGAEPPRGPREGLVSGGVPQAQACAHGGVTGLGELMTKAGEAAGGRLLWSRPGISCSSSLTPKDATLFESGFVREAVNKLGRFPSDKVLALNLRAPCGAQNPAVGGSQALEAGGRKREDPESLPRSPAEHLLPCQALPPRRSPPREGAALGSAGYGDEMASLLRAGIIKEGISPGKVVESSFGGAHFSVLILSAFFFLLWNGAPTSEAT